MATYYLKLYHLQNACHHARTGKKVLSFDNHMHCFKHPQSMCSTTLRTQCTLAHGMSCGAATRLLWCNVMEDNFLSWSKCYQATASVTLVAPARALLPPGTKGTWCVLLSDTHRYLSSSCHLPTSLRNAISKLFQLDTLNPGCRFSN